MKSVSVERLAITIILFVAIALSCLVLFSEVLWQIDETGFKVMTLIGVASMAFCAIGLFWMQKRNREAEFEGDYQAQPPAQRYPPQIYPEPYREHAPDHYKEQTPDPYREQPPEQYKEQAPEPYRERPAERSRMRTAKLYTEPLPPVNVDDGVEAIQLKFTDPLTGLGNRERLADKFNNLVKLAVEDAHGHPNEDVQFSIGLLDLDGMKLINDMFGREGGDAILKQCALRLSNAVGEEGLVTRLGGDEFAFIFPDITSEDEIEAKGNLLLEVLQAPYDLDGRAVRLSGSFGVGVVPQVGQQFEMVSDNLARALDQSKSSGRGRVTVYSKELEQEILEEAMLEQALRRAIDHAEVLPHFQPIISLQDGSLLGFEALARWIDPEMGHVSPVKFIPLAEERGMIAPLTESLLRQAASAAVLWPEELFLSFNLSSVQLVDPTTAETILSIIRGIGLDPKRIEMEVTETAMMSDPETAATVLADLSSAGVRISMDDFGTGQSSLGRLRELHLDKVKIDRAFIKPICEDKAAEHIVRAVLELCTGLNLTVVAEGIETLPQAELLKRIGCHAGQGFLFGKPQNERRTLAYIREYMGDSALGSAQQAAG